jgi:hypothetical protein
MHMTLFSTESWITEIANWNVFARRDCLARLGTVCFRIQESAGDSSNNINFDRSGSVAIVVDDLSAAYAFDTAPSNWIAYISGEFTASQGVLNGRLNFSDGLIGPLPDSIAFNIFAGACEAFLPQRCPLTQWSRVMEEAVH